MPFYIFRAEVWNRGRFSKSVVGRLGFRRNLLFGLESSRASPGKESEVSEIAVLFLFLLMESAEVDFKNHLNELTQKQLGGGWSLFLTFLSPGFVPLCDRFFASNDDVDSINLAAGRELSSGSSDGKEILNSWIPRRESSVESMDPSQVMTAAALSLPGIL